MIDATKNHIWGFLHISENYTATFFQRIMENRRAEEDILEQSEIAVKMDMSSKYKWSNLQIEGFEKDIWCANA